jgi:phosphatidylinositol-3-phosphatase
MRPVPRSRSLTSLATLVLTAAVLVAAGPAASAPAAAAAKPPCGTRPESAPATYSHVIVIMDENRSFRDIIGRHGSAAARAAPYLNRLAAACGLASNYFGVTHPSHPNYMAVTGGISTAAAVVDAPSIFRQVGRAGGSWRVYQEAMPANCDRRSAYPYKAGHNPGLSYAPIRLGCRLWDVGWSTFTRDLRTGSLPTYAFITPDQCHNMHRSCVGGTSAIRAGDDWMRTWIPRLTATPGYRAGRTAIFITWDEGSHGQTPAHRHEDCLARIHRHDETCHVATLVLAAEVSPGTRSAAFFSHYSLLQTTERLIGIPAYLGHAGDPTTAGMRSAFGF